MYLQAGAPVMGGSDAVLPLPAGGEGVLFDGFNQGERVMAGTREGGLKIAAALKAKFGEDYYIGIGQRGGQASRNGGFASMKIGKDGLTGFERARIVGAKGGSKSKRGEKQWRSLTN